MQLVMTILVGGILFVTGMYFFRKITAGEQFDLKRYGETLGYVTLLAVGAYVATGIIPDFTAILAKLEAGLPESSTIMTLAVTTGLAIYNKIIKLTGAPTEPTATTDPLDQAEAIATVPTVVGVQDWLSFKMTPSFPSGISPFAQLFKFYATQPQPDHPGVASVDVDWDDGTPVQNVPMKEGYAEVSHTFVYVQGTSPYYAKQFSPVFTAVGSDGSKKRYNLTTDGFTKFCMVEVQSIITGTKPMPE